MSAAQMDPWLPELELRPPAVAHAHRVSVEQAKVGLVWYYNSRHDALRANKYRDDAFFWRVRRLNQVRREGLAFLMRMVSWRVCALCSWRP